MAIAACTIWPGWLLGGLRLPSPLIGVGADWLRVRVTRSTTGCRSTSWSGWPWRSAGPTAIYLVMEDREGRKLRVHLDELRSDRRVFEAFLSRVRHARSTGLTLNKATAMELGARP
jgi:hypothetical protein